MSRKSAAALACWLGMALSAEAQFVVPGGDAPVPIGLAGTYPPGPPGAENVPPGLPSGYFGPGVHPGPAPEDLIHRQPMPERFQRELMRDNGPSAWEDERLYSQPIRFQASLDYLFMWFRSNHIPALVTTGATTDNPAGAIGIPTTNVVFGNQNTYTGMAAGVRANFVWYVVDPEIVSIEGNYFLMERRSFTNDFVSNAAGFPLLARPYYDPSTGLSTSKVFSSPKLVGGFQGSTHDSFTTNIMGAETNLAYNVSGFNHYDGASLILLAGARWLNIREQYFGYSVATANPIGIGNQNIYSDTFNTGNQFIGGQLGAKVRLRRDRSSLDLFTKIAVGPNFQSVDANGYHITRNLKTAPAGVTVDPNNGFYVRTSNAGLTNNSAISFAPEVGLTYGFELNDNIRFNVGYNILYINNLVRPEGVINSNLASNPGVNNIVAPTPNQYRYDSTLWLQSLTVGIEFLF